MRTLDTLQRLRRPAGGVRGLRRKLLSWWWGLPEVLRSRTWPTAFACLAILALLLGFRDVVVMSVQQGELLRMAAATQAEAVWRCNALSGAAMRSSCIAQLNAPPHEEAVSVAPPNGAALQVAQAGR